MDYRLLLMKYVRHVSACEGTDFIAQIGDRMSLSDVTFTAEETAALTLIAALSDLPDGRPAVGTSERLTGLQAPKCKCHPRCPTWVEGGPAVFADRVVRAWVCIDCGARRYATEAPTWMPPAGWAPGAASIPPVHSTTGE
jgi:hypothetical protein